MPTESSASAISHSRSTAISAQKPARRSPPPRARPGRSHVAKRLGIGEAGLMDNPARGFDYALNEEEERRGAGDYEGLG